MATRAKPARRRKKVEVVEPEVIEEVEEEVDEEAEDDGEYEDEGGSVGERREMLDATQLDWDSIMSGFAGSGTVLFVKDTLKVRCLPIYDITELFVPVKSFYQGTESKKFLMPVWWKDAPAGDSPIRCVLMTSKLCRSMVALGRNEEYALFDPDDGVGLAIVKTGSGPGSSVTINPGRAAVPIPEAVLDYYDEFDLFKVAQEFSDDQERRNSEQQQSKGDGKAQDESW